MAVLTVQEIDRSTGIVPAYAAVAASDSFANDGRTYLHVKNGSAGSLTVTITLAQTVDGQTPAAKTFTVAAGVERVIGPFPPTVYNDANGRVVVAYSATTTITAGTFRLP